MTPAQARIAIGAILDTLADSQLPKPSKVEERDGDTVVWFGGHGYHIGSGRNGFGETIVTDYRARGIQGAMEQERVNRIERAHHAAVSA
jgi:hypothetical protein